MLSAKKLRNYFRKHWNKIIPISKNIARQPDSEKIHDLRVHGKKVKAATALLQSVFPGSGNYAISPVKPLFRDAGNVRTAEMHLKLFKDAGLTDKILENEQRSQITWGYVLLGMKRKDYLKNIKEVRKRLERSIKNMKNKQVVEYFKESIDALALGFLWPIDISQLHENRKLAKNLMYTYDMLPKKLQRKIALNKEYLDRLQDAIGQWHDLAVTLELLEGKGRESDASFMWIKQKESEKLEEIKKELELFERKVYTRFLSNSVI